MSGRTLSDKFRLALYSQETGEVVAFLLTFEHADLTEPLRLSTDPTQRLSTNPLQYGTISRGNTFLFAPIDVLLPEDIDGGDPRASLAIDNVGRELIDAIRSIEEGAIVLLEAVLASAPDVVEISFPQLKMTNSEYTLVSLTVDLTIDHLTTEPYPGDSFTKAYFPGLT